jgi:hypothetical protein
MVNSRGWFKVFEAIMACLILLGVFLFLFNENSYGSHNDYLSEEHLDKILDGIMFNETLRGAAMTNDKTTLRDYVNNNLNSFYNFSINICELGTICPSEESSKNTFSKQKIIASNLTFYSPKQIKLNIWER